MWPIHIRRSVVLTFYAAVLALAGNVLASYIQEGQRFRYQQRIQVPKRKLTPPFPDGPCGGQLVSLSPGTKNALLVPERYIQVWLPPGYETTSELRYPTLYCHDGQNTINDDESWTGRSWRLAGALTRLSEHSLIQSLPIVVLLPSIDGDLVPGIRRRHLEYGDVNLPFASSHVDYVANVVKPFIDDRFRTRDGAENSFCMGASLGGQASLHLLLRHPDKFGGAACLSPYFGPGILSLAGEFGVDALTRKKVYIDIGGDLGNATVPLFDLLDHTTSKHSWNPGYFWLDTSLQPAVQAMRRRLDDTKVIYQYHEIPGGRHNERAWSMRIDKPLKFLLGV